MTMKLKELKQLIREEIFFEFSPFNILKEETDLEDYNEISGVEISIKISTNYDKLQPKTIKWLKDKIIRHHDDVKVNDNTITFLFNKDSIDLVKTVIDELKGSIPILYN